MGSTGAATATLLGSLGAGCPAREAGPGDDIAGVQPSWVLAPTTTAQAAAGMRAAAGHGLSVVARGFGTKQHWAAPPERCDVVVETGGISGVVDHAAGDLVAVVRAGTTMADLQAVLARAGQQLAIDAAGGSVGGAVATGVSGPRRLAYGTLRDLVIGITVVRADGRVASAGGRVVKNVAGYDLGKLFTGSYGTLGLVLQAAFRLHPLPVATAWVRGVVDGPAGPAEAARLAAAVRSSQLVPAAVEVDGPPDGQVEVAVLLEGTVAGVQGRAAQAARLLGAGAPGEPPDWWGVLPFAAGEVGVKLTTALSGVAGLLGAARELGVHVRGSAGVGVLHAGLPAGDPPAVARAVAALRAAATAGGGHAVVLSAPAGVRAELDAWGPVPGLELMRRVKDQLDPEHRLAPGRFVGGI